MVAEGTPCDTTSDTIGSFNGAATTWSRKVGRSPRPRHVRRASTGPRPRGRGRPGASATAADQSALQRGRDHVVAEGGGTSTCSSVYALLQRGRDHVVAEGVRGEGAPAHPHRFNGAATTWSRKVVEQRRASGLRIRLQRGRDHVVAEGAAAAAAAPAVAASFNGAATTWSRKEGERIGTDAIDPASTGPRPRGRGRLFLGGLLAPPRLRLQRGRDHVVAEGHARPPGQRQPHDASTGPRPRGRGRLIRRWMRNQVEEASTGPRPRGRGRSPWRRRNMATATASTGPRPRGRGRTYQSVLVRISYGFNGAATTWSRKEVDEAAPHAPPEPASTGPRPRGRGRRTHSLRTPMRCTTLQRGRDHVVAEGRNASTSAVPDDHASTGPRPRGRGRPRRSRRRATTPRASTGPRPRGRGRLVPRRAAERTCAASTGPRPRGRGRGSGSSSTTSG
mgnify:CR=1 FL=1